MESHQNLGNVQLQHGQLVAGKRRWCGDCNEDYHYNAWSDHLRSYKHNNRNNTKFKCNRAGCSASYNRKDALAFHEKNKHKYQCDAPNCNFAADTPANLAVHKQAHELEFYRHRIAELQRLLGNKSSFIQKLLGDVAKLEQENRQLRARSTS